MNLFKFQEPVSLKIPIAFEEGAVIYSQIEAVAVSMPEKSIGVGAFMPTGNRSVLLIKSPFEPVPGTLVITVDGALEIGGVKVCRNLDGEVEAYRCSVVHN